MGRNKNFGRGGHRRATSGHQRRHVPEANIKRQSKNFNTGFGHITGLSPLVHPRRQPRTHTPTRFPWTLRLRRTYKNNLAIRVPGGGQTYQKIHNGSTVR